MQDDILERREAAGEQDNRLRLKHIRSGGKAGSQRSIAAGKARVKPGKGDGCSLDRAGKAGRAGRRKDRACIVDS